MQYKYKGLTKEGKKVKGVIVAGTLNETKQKNGVKKWGQVMNMQKMGSGDEKMGSGDEYELF